MITDIERPNYADGQYLGPADFVSEQRYHRDARRRQNLSGQTWGIFAGLELVSRPRAGDDELVDKFVAPGYAVDGFGRELVVFHPEPLDVAWFRAAGVLAEEWVRVWLSYSSEETRPAAPGFERCCDPEWGTRTREGFRICVGDFDPWHDRLVVDGRELDDDDLLPDLSIPHQALPDDAARKRWLVPLGQVRWDGDGAFLAEKTDADRMKAAAGRVHGGVVGDKVLAPGTLRLSDRASASPLPAKRPGVHVRVEGSLSVDRHAGVNIDAAAAAPLTVRAGGKNDRLVAFVNDANDPLWHFELNAGAQPGLNLTETSPDVPRLFVAEGGRVGVRTTTPRNALAVRAIGPSEELISFENAGGQTKWHINQLLGGGKPGFNLAETGVADGRLFVAAGGNVGVGTVQPAARLDLTGGDLRWAGGSILSTDQGGSIELGGNPNAPGSGRPAVNFHFQGRQQPFNTRIVNDADGQLTLGAAVAHTTGSVKADGSVRTDGIVATNGYPATPATPGWGGGIRTWDVEAHATIWAERGFAIGASRTKVPVDVLPGSVSLGSGQDVGSAVVNLQSRLPSAATAELLVVPTDADPGNGGWAVTYSSAKTGDNTFTFTISWNMFGGELYALRFVAVFSP